MPEAARILEPLARHLVDQVQVMRFCWRVCGIGGRLLDGTEEPNPFDPAAPDAWVLTEAESEAAGLIVAEFHRLVRVVADVLQRVGVSVDAEWGSDQAVIGVLLLLPLIGYKVPWDADPRELADQLQPPGVSAIERDGRGASARDSRTDDQARNADRIRRHIRSENGGRDLRAPYAGGGPRVIPQTTRIRREIIKEICTDRPDLTVAQLLLTYDNSEKTAGGRLRTTLAQRFKEAGLVEPDRPSRTVLFEDFKVLGIPTGSNGSPSAKEASG